MPPRKKDVSPDALSKYRDKRSADITPEPFSTPSDLRPGQFVVQKHAARRTHYDLRLEWNGTLWSWAVPNGFSYNPADKRLAVHVEDHPVEYADFEGVIPKDQYGAGAMIVWDRGTWVPLTDPDEGLVTGKIHFELKGFKLHGEWELIKPKAKIDRGTQEEWLLFKKKDGWASTKETPLDERSILSGLTVEELGKGDTKTDAIRTRLEELGAPRRTVDPTDVSLMLAETSKTPFSHPEWLFELKYDGFRLLAARREDGSASLLYRSGMEVSWLFPDVARAIRSLPYDNLVVDAEVVVLDEAGHPDFQKLQKRAQLKKRGEIEPATVLLPATLYVFDLLAFEDFDLRPLPLRDRKALLREILPGAGPIRFAEHFEGVGELLFEQVSALGLEGIIAKKASSPYKPGRSPYWLKIVADKVQDFAVCGFSEPKGNRSGIGALHLCFCTPEGYTYAGRVGTGFSDKLLNELRAAMDPVKSATPPANATGFPRGKGNWWVEPSRVVQVKYKTWTEEGLLRLPVYMRMRDDKNVADCIRAVEEAPPEVEMPVVKEAAEAGSEAGFQITRPEKIFWPKEGYTKGDLIEFYRSVSPWLMPYLKDRPLVLTRYPDGIEGKSFYQKNAPEYVPDWVQTETIWSESAGKDIEYFVCNTEEMLLYIANMGSIPLHVWPSRITDIQKPDWSIIDLDPKEAPFAHVVKLAQATGRLCEDIGLPSFIKTSGSTGLHILIPLGGQCTFEQSRLLANLVSVVLEQENKEIATTVRTISARGGKVYLDYLQNRHGQLLVSPFSVRPLPGAPVSTPLLWSEVNDRLDPRGFTIRTVVSRLQKLKEDPLRGVLTLKPDLAGVLTRLDSRLRKGR